MFEFLADTVERAKEAGYDAVRAAGEMTWQLGGDPGSEKLMEYEAKLNDFLDEYDLLAICQYNRERFAPEVIRDVISTHPHLVYGYAVCENYYYVPPDEFLGGTQSQEVERILTGLLERQRLRERLADREQQLQVLNTVLRHNLRNDMNVVLGHAELLAERGDDEGRRSAETILNVGRELVSLSEKARDIEAVLGEPAELVTVDVTSVVERRASAVSAREEKADVTVETPGSVPVSAVENVGLAIGELLENAIEHADNERPAVEVTVREPTGGVVEVRVADDGPGIPEDEIRLVTEEHSIEPLYHGTGLGLWIVQWLVERSGGVLRFEENVPRGSVVVMRLPSGADDATEAAGQEPEIGSAECEPGRDGPDE
ncbi:MAG: MEDS domain-containing protein [Salinigranum sp.]